MKAKNKSFEDINVFKFYIEKGNIATELKFLHRFINLVRIYFLSNS